MVTSKTPLRISFVGGGTDIAWFYEKHGGAVISTAIDKYVTVEVREDWKTGRRASEHFIVTPLFGSLWRTVGKNDKTQNRQIEPIFFVCLKRYQKVQRECNFEIFSL